MPTFEWHYFYFVPTYNNEDCDFYRMIVSIKPSETQIKVRYTYEVYLYSKCIMFYRTQNVFINNSLYF